MTTVDEQSENSIIHTTANRFFYVNIKKWNERKITF